MHTAAADERLVALAQNGEQCRHVREQMSDYLDGDLDPQATRAVTRHTRICPNCRRLLANLTRTATGLRALNNLAPGSRDVTPTDDRAAGRGANG